MRYPLRHRARQGGGQSHVKADLPVSWPSNAKRTRAASAGRTGPRVSAQLKCGLKSTVGAPCPRERQSLSSAAAEGWFASQTGPLHPRLRSVLGKKSHAPQGGASAPPEAPLGFEPRISCLLDRRFNQLSHGAIPHGRGGGGRLRGSKHPEKRRCAA
ncbi:hypothetical protein QQF64_008373 [Cirrhinus molitorella]|uniref:Uncharacterized protein n=1 Tax=Cirrhinus molitorella TaxID=172907 RepID=A0ABR3M8G9_9TELE